MALCPKSVRAAGASCHYSGLSRLGVNPLDVALTLHALETRKKSATLVLRRQVSKRAGRTTDPNPCKGRKEEMEATGTSTK